MKSTLLEKQLKLEDIPQISTEIASVLDDLKLDKKEKQMVLLLTEELSVPFLECNQEVTVKLTNRLGETHLVITAKGDELNPLSIINEWDNDDDMERIRRTIFCTYRDNLSYSRKGNQNTIFLKAHDSHRKQVVFTLGAMIAGLIFGIGMKMFLPEAITAVVDSNVFYIVKTLFLNSLKMMIAPVVFFSLVLSISSLTNLSEIGRMAGKLMSLYMFTTVIAIAIGFGASALILSGGDLAMQVAGDAATRETVTVSFRDLIAGIAPKNMISPILETNMLQVIFISLLVGISISILGTKVNKIQNLVEQCNLLCTQIINMLMRFVPLMAFCSMASLMISMGAESIMMILRLIAGIAIGTVVLLTAYAVLVALIGRLSPVTFLKKLIPYMLTPFSISSSNACIPLTMEFAEKKMGVNSKISSFSIPIGATVNMDGTCLFLIIGICLFAKMAGMDIDGSFIFTVAVSTFVLSIGAPGVQGSGILCLSTLVATMGLPMEYIGLIIGIDQLMSMTRTASNVVGDVCATVITAKSEKMLDLEVFKKS